MVGMYFYDWFQTMECLYSLPILKFYACSRKNGSLLDSIYLGKSHY